MPVTDIRDLDVRGLRDPQAVCEVEHELVGLCRSGGELRAALCRIASRFVLLRAWQRVGYARLSDYAAERAGRSARSIQDWAHVGERLGHLPALERALVSGALGWTRVRLLARVAERVDEERWIAYARRVSAVELAREVRRVDRGSVEAGATEDESERRSRLFEVRCTERARRKWLCAQTLARRVSGAWLNPSACAELVAAEVLSAVPVETPMDAVSLVPTAATGDSGKRAHPGSEASDPPWRTATVEERSAARRQGREPTVELSSRVERLVEGLESADAFELDRRLRACLRCEQRHDARIGPLLELVWRSWIHRMLGYASREAHARERLGMDPTRARALVRLERVARQSPAFARAYRRGRLSWVKANLIAPFVLADGRDRWAVRWVRWSGAVTVRRLREDVERALLLMEVDPGSWARSGGLPQEALAEEEGDAPGSVDREIGARASEAGAPSEGGPEIDGDREIGARASVADETCLVRFFGPAEAVQLFRAVVCTVRRHLERQNGRLPTPGEAFEAMLDHVLEVWNPRDQRTKAAHRVFERDGWRCVVPGCTSMRNLHDHHIRFRSAGGSADLANRVTLCAFHHLRGVHAGTLRCRGEAPDALRFELGIRPGDGPILRYVSGDRQV